ncbi:MAG TPA: purine-nucleoside phosphorylase [Candidatus Brocadiia bacterium]|nr:purine-nucleoside phosphorylase [Planctomycetota bacterium]MDO8094302.1 purine-nucleoside phosphorylase [Candidatus Brocadiales bacterium]
MTKHIDTVQESIEYIKSKATIAVPHVGIVLGSGWNYFAETLDDKCVINYSDIPCFPLFSAEAYRGKLIIGKLGDVSIACLQGRLHCYEGYTARQSAYPIRILCGLGIHALVVTNAAGGINPKFSPGDFMLITDQINMSGDDPVRAFSDTSYGARFPDMSEAYNKELIQDAEDALRRLGIAIKKGVYIGVSGPSFETPAEIRMFRLFGADAVGMSTVPEVIAANQMGIKVCGLSCITNMAAGISLQKISHEEVLATMESLRDKSVSLLKAVVTAVCQKTGNRRLKAEG